MNFVNFSRFYADIAAWERTLPQFDAVCGIPRSGVIPAAYIAVRRNIRLVDFSAALNDLKTSIENAPLREVNPIAKKPHGYRLLIVDDSTTALGTTIKSLKGRLSVIPPVEVSYGAVYCENRKSCAADFWHEEISLPRLFEWNWCRHVNLSRLVLDMDGVICEDFVAHQERSEDSDFVKHVEQARPIWLPERPVLAIATSRLERYRKQTEVWLAGHGVHYGSLHMHPADSPEERRALGDHADRKASVYSRYPRALLFVESELKQAQRIRRLSGRPVLCTATMTLVSNGR